MIASLRGQVQRVDEEGAVIDVGGVGYQVYMSPRSSACLRSGDTVELQIHTVVREDAIALYGFESLQELALFKQLIGVERIGPKAALAILARAEWSVIASAIRSGDHALLATVPGVGPKTAQRIVLELRGRVEAMVVAPSGAASPVEPELRVATQVEEALISLGFSAVLARAVVAEEMVRVGPSTESARTVAEMVSACLKRLRPTGLSV